MVKNKSSSHNYDYSPPEILTICPCIKVFSSEAREKILLPTSLVDAIRLVGISLILFLRFLLGTLK